MQSNAKQNTENYDSIQNSKRKNRAITLYETIKGRTGIPNAHAPQLGIPDSPNNTQNRKTSKTYTADATQSDVSDSTPFHS